MKKLKLIGAMGRAILLAVIAILLVVTPIFAYTYYCTIQVVETGGSAYSYLPLSDNINNLYLSQNGYMLSSGNDTQVIEGATQLQHMVASDRVLFVVPSIAALSYHNCKYTMGNTPASNFPIIVGYGGNVTINDAAALELGNSFEIEQRGYVDTTSGSNKNLVCKNGSFRIYISATGNITAGCSSIFPAVAAVNGGNDVVNQVNHTVNLPAGIASGDLLLVFFGSDGSPAVTFPGGWVQLFQIGAFVAWYRIADGTEGATITVTTTNVQMTAHTSYRITGYSGVPEAATATGADANPNPPNLTPSWGAENTLWFAATGYDVGTITVDAYPTNYTNGRNDRSNHAEGFGVGSAERDLNAASEDPGTFTLSAGTPWLAGTVAIAPASETSATATGISSGVRKIAASDNTTHITISVYDESDVLIDTHSTAFAGNVVDNANNWLIGQNDVIPYMEYYKHTVSGVLIANYQPNTIVLGQEHAGSATDNATFVNGSPNVTGSGTSWTSAMDGSLIWLNADDVWHVVSSVTDTTHLTLTANYAGAGGTGIYTMAPRLVDLQGASHDGAIAWGTNPAGLSLTTSGLVSSSQPASSGGTIPAPQDVIPETEQPGWFDVPAGSDLASEVFYPFVDWFCDATDLFTGGAGFNPYQVYLIFAMVVTMGATALAAWAFRSHLLFAGIIGLVATSFFVAYHSIFPWWTIIVSVFFFFATIIFERKPVI